MYLESACFLIKEIPFMYVSQVMGTKRVPVVYSEKENLVLFQAVISCFVP